MKSFFTKGFLPILIITATLATQPGHAQEEPKPTPIAPQTQKQIAIGDKAPNFTLHDASGTPHSLENHLKKGPVALVFYRSGHW